MNLFKNKKSKRAPLNFNGSTTDIILLMSEGNPGAISVLSRLLKEYPDEGLLGLLHLDDMNIRGTQIWIGYKDFCKENISNFLTAIYRRDPEMIDIINNEGELGNHKDKAVVSGGKDNRLLL